MITMDDLSDEQRRFLDSFTDNFLIKYPTRYIVGVKKYKSTIHKDYTIEEHIDNAEEEMFDGLAYIHAMRYLVADLRAENAGLKERLSKYEQL